MAELPSTNRRWMRDRFEKFNGRFAFVNDLRSPTVEYIYNYSDAKELQAYRIHRQRYFVVSAKVQSLVKFFCITNILGWGNMQNYLRCSFVKRFKVQEKSLASNFQTSETRNTCGRETFRITQPRWLIRVSFSTRRKSKSKSIQIDRSLLGYLVKLSIISLGTSQTAGFWSVQKSPGPRVSFSLSRVRNFPRKRRKIWKIPSIGVHATSLPSDYS